KSKTYNGGVWRLRDGAARRRRGRGLWPRDCRPAWRSRIRLCPVKGRNETKTIRDKRAKMAAPASPPSRLVPLHANDAAGSVQNMTRVLRHTLSTTDGTTPTRCVAVAYGLDHSLRAPKGNRARYLPSYVADLPQPDLQQWCRYSAAD
ncbi:hypothetical protein BD626DRAFT_519142, partial [Schizophyllum amplum]